LPGGASRLAALLVAYIFPICALLAPCQPGAALRQIVTVLRIRDTSVQLLRRVIFWCHLVAGAVAGSIVLIMSVTGVLLTYERQVNAWADTRALRSAPPSGATRLAPDALLATVRAANPGVAVTTLTMWSDPSAPAAAALGQRTVYVNPYSGQMLGEAAAQPRTFFRKMTDWHRWLGVTGEGRATARMITGACNLAFLFLVVSGFYLWVPRAWSWRQVRAVLWFRGGLAGKARDFNWHNTIGLWSAIPLFVIVASGVVMSYPWANDLVYRVNGEAPPGRAGGAGGGPGGAGGGRGGGGASADAPASASLDASWARATQQVEDWRSISVRVPGGSAETAAFTIDRGTGGAPQKRGTLTVNTRTAEVVKWEPFSSLTPGRRLRSYVRFGHTGEAWGVIGQTVAGLVSLGAAVLVYTGLSLAIRRFWAWRARRASVRASIAA
jgi:uncharacterized iron-regulated membrane protein